MAIRQSGHLLLACRKNQDVRTPQAQRGISAITYVTCRIQDVRGPSRRQKEKEPGRIRCNAVRAQPALIVQGSVSGDNGAYVGELFLDRVRHGLALRVQGLQQGLAAVQGVLEPLVHGVLDF